ACSYRPPSIAYRRRMAQDATTYDAPSAAAGGLRAQAPPGRFTPSAPGGVEPATRGTASAGMGPATSGEVTMATPSPTGRRKRLGIELRRLREQAGLTCEEVGRRLECSGTRISRMETGRIAVRPGDARELLELYGVTGPEADALVQLAREARRKGWWHTY